MVRPLLLRPTKLLYRLVRGSLMLPSLSGGCLAGPATDHGTSGLTILHLKSHQPLLPSPEFPSISDNTMVPDAEVLLTGADSVGETLPSTSRIPAALLLLVGTVHIMQWPHVPKNFASPEVVDGTPQPLLTPVITPTLDHTDQSVLSGIASPPTHFLPGVPSKILLWCPFHETLFP